MLEYQIAEIEAANLRAGERFGIKPEREWYSTIKQIAEHFDSTYAG